ARSPAPEPHEAHRACSHRREGRGARDHARGRQARRPPKADRSHRGAVPVLRPGEGEAALLIESLSAEQVEAFERDGFLIVEEGLVSKRGLELLENRYVKLFEGEYETGIRP